MSKEQLKKDIKPTSSLTKWDIEVWRAAMTGESQLRLPFKEFFNGKLR